MIYRWTSLRVCVISVERRREGGREREREREREMVVAKGAELYNG